MDSRSPLTEALLYDILSRSRVRCRVCQRHCVIEEGNTGHCTSRRNVGGKLYTLIYGLVSSASVNPIEKKPVYHFMPGSSWLSLGSLGCNFRCPGCQNWDIAHADAASIIPAWSQARFIPPREAVELATARGCAGISWTFNEPTIWFEYTLDSAMACRRAGLFTNYVTNGSISHEALDLIGPYLDLFRVDLKGFSRRAYSALAGIENFTGVLRTAERARGKWGMHLEVVTNVIPGINDDPGELAAIACWIRDALSPDTPWHLTRFYPHRFLSHLPPTPVDLLERARESGIKGGLRYVYIGNVPGHPAANSYCHGCGRLIIERDLFTVVSYKLVGNRCSSCGAVIPGRFDESATPV